MESSESHRQLQLFRAELSSNPSFIWLRGSTTAKGLYANSFFVLSHYAFGGRQSAGAVCVCALHFDHGVEQACSAAARVPPRSPSPGAPLLRVLVHSLRYEASSLPEGCRRRIRWDPSSLRPHVRVLRRAYLCAGSTSTGAFGRVSRARLCTSSSFFSCCPECSSGCSARSMSSGAVGRVSRSRLCTSAHPSWSRPLLSAGIASSCSRSAWQVRFTGWPGQVRLFQLLEGGFGDSPGILKLDPLFGF